MAEELGSLAVKIGLDSSGFQSGVSNINKSLRVLDSEFKLNTSALGENAKGLEGLKLKSENLTKSTELQKQKVSALETAYNKSVETKGKDAKATQDLEIKLNQAKTTLNKMSTELDATNKKIDVQSSGWTKFGEKMSSIGEKMKSVGEGFSNVGSKLSMSLTAPILGVGTAAVKLASDLNESLNKVDVAFGKSANGVKDWSNSTLKSFGIAKGTALDMASGYGDMATSMGVPKEAAAKMSEKLVGLAGDLSSFKNIGIGEANTALTSIFTGETESLKKLGIVMTQANLQEYAASQGIKKKIQDMTQEEQTQLRYNYVLEKTKNAQGDFAKTSGGTANSARIFQESLKQLGETMGQNILPVITPIIQKLSEIVQHFGKLSPEMQKTILIIGGIAAAIGPVLLIIGKLITIGGTLSTVFGAISTAVGATGGVLAVLTGPVGIVVGILAGLVTAGVLVYKNWDTIKAKAKELSTAIATIFNSIKTSIVNTWENTKTTCTNTFTGISNFLKDTWNSVKTTTESVWNGIVKGVIAIIQPFVNKINNVFDGMKGGLTNILNGIKLYFTTVWDAIKTIVLGVVVIFCDLMTGNFGKLKEDTNKIFERLKDDFGKIWEGIKQIFTGVLQTILGICKNEWNGIKTITESVWNGISGFFRGLWNGISSLFNGAINGIKNTVSTVWNGILSTTTSVWNNVKSAIMSPISFAVNFVETQINKIKGFFSGLDIKFPHIDLPHFSLKGKFSLNPPSVPSLGIDWYAKGGVFSSPTVIGVGEAGREAVMPLDHNTGWIDELASKLNGKAGTQSITITVPVTLDGRTIATVVAPYSDKIQGKNLNIAGRGLGI